MQTIDEQRLHQTLLTYHEQAVLLFVGYLRTKVLFVLRLEADLVFRFYRQLVVEIKTESLSS